MRGDVNPRERRRRFAANLCSKCGNEPRVWPGMAWGRNCNNERRVLERRAISERRRQEKNRKTLELTGGRCIVLHCRRQIANPMTKPGGKRLPSVRLFCPECYAELIDRWRKDKRLSIRQYIRLEFEKLEQSRGIINPSIMRPKKFGLNDRNTDEAA